MLKKAFNTLIGFLHLTRGTAVRHVRGVAADGAAISVGEPEFPLMATMYEWEPTTLHAMRRRSPLRPR